MADLTTLAAVKTFAGVTGSGNDAELTGIISAVSEIFAQWVGHDYDATARTEKLSGNGLPSVIVARPMGSVTSVTLETTALVENTGFEWKVGERAVYRLATGKPASWELGTRNVTVIYAPTNTVPADLEIAAREASVFVWKQSHGGDARVGLENKGNDAGGLQQYVTDMLELPLVKATIRAHRRLY